MHPGIFAERTPDKPAYIMAASGAVVTYRELDEQSNRIARLFRRLGLARRDGVAIFMENNRHFLQICWGARRAGLYYTCVSSHLTADEVAYIVRDCGARVFITSPTKAEIAGEVRRRLPADIACLMVDEAQAGFEAFAPAVAAEAPRPIADQCEGADMLYSSGTTGRPKGVKLPIEGEPFGTVSPVLDILKGLYRIDGDSVYLSPAPLYHAAPLRFTMSMHRFGATSVVMERFDPAEALALIERYRVTHSQWVPTMFIRMLKLPDAVRRRHDLSSHRVAIHAAAPCPIEVKERMIDWWGPILHEYYAGTEGNGYCAISSAEWLKHKGSVGRALVGVAHIVGEDGRELPPGEPGLIYFSDGNPFEYHNDPEKTAAATNEAGWTTLGDIGYLDADGYLYLTDRKAHMIISGGVNIYPQEVENLLATHPAVLDVAVFGVPNQEFGEEVKAVVQPVDVGAAGPALAEELMEFCRRHLSHVKCPRSIDFEPSLPRHDNGKLYKRLLKDRYWGKRDTRII